MHSYTKFELDKSKFAQVRKFAANLKKIKNPKNLNTNRFSRNSISKVVYQYIIFVCSSLVYNTLSLNFYNIQKKFLPSFQSLQFSGTSSIKSLKKIINAASRNCTCYEPGRYDNIDKHSGRTE